jgi:hypothetical protein
VDWFENISSGEPPGARSRLNLALAHAHQQLGARLLAAGSVADARAQSRQSLELRQAVAAGDQDDQKGRDALVVLFGKLSERAQMSGDLEAARKDAEACRRLAEEGLEAARRQGQGELKRAQVQLAFSTVKLGDAEFAEMRFPSALASYSQGLTDLQAMGAVHLPLSHEVFNQLLLWVRSQKTKCQSLVPAFEDMRELTKAPREDALRLLVVRAVELADRGMVDRVDEVAVAMRSLGPDDPRVVASVAACYARCVAAGDIESVRAKYTDRALRELSRAVNELGFRDLRAGAFLELFDPIRKDSRFAALLQQTQDPGPASARGTKQ